MAATTVPTGPGAVRPAGQRPRPPRHRRCDLRRVGVARRARNRSRTVPRPLRLRIARRPPGTVVGPVHPGGPVGCRARGGRTARGTALAARSRHRARRRRRVGRGPTAGNHAGRDRPRRRTRCADQGRHVTTLPADTRRYRERGGPRRITPPQPADPARRPGDDRAPHPGRPVPRHRTARRPPGCDRPGMGGRGRRAPRLRRPDVATVGRLRTRGPRSTRRHGRLVGARRTPADGPKRVHRHRRRGRVPRDRPGTRRDGRAAARADVALDRIPPREPSALRDPASTGRARGVRVAPRRVRGRTGSRPPRIGRGR